MTDDLTATLPTARRRDAERGGAALLIIDTINGFDIEGADLLRTKATSVGKAILDGMR